MIGVPGSLGACMCMCGHSEGDEAHAPGKPRLQPGVSRRALGPQGSLKPCRPLRGQPPFGAPEPGADDVFGARLCMPVRKGGLSR